MANVTTKAPVRILVVDDLVDLAEGLSTLFSALGHQTRVANDGWEAIDVFKAFEPDIVFLDLQMPKLDGYEAARAIRADPEVKQPYLIALTASQGMAVQVATQAVGFDSYIHKPAHPHTLIAVVTDIASRL